MPFGVWPHRTAADCSSFDYCDMLLVGQTCHDISCLIIPLSYNGRMYCVMCDVRPKGTKHRYHDINNVPSVGFHCNAVARLRSADLTRRACALVHVRRLSIPRGNAVVVFDYFQEAWETVLLLPACELCFAIKPA